MEAIAYKNKRFQEKDLLNHSTLSQKKKMNCMRWLTFANRNRAFPNNFPPNHRVFPSIFFLSTEASFHHIWENRFNGSSGRIAVNDFDPQPGVDLKRAAGASFAVTPLSIQATLLDLICVIGNLGACESLTVIVDRTADRNGSTFMFDEGGAS